MSAFTFSHKFGYLNVELSYLKHLSEAQIKSNDSLLVLGRSKDLKKLKFDHLKSALNALEIPEDWYSQSVGFLTAKSNSNSSEVDVKVEDGSSKPSSIAWLNKLIVHKIGGKCSRNNTPSRAHSITKFVRSNCIGQNQYIIVACEKKNSVASACAVARAYPLFSGKSDKPTVSRKVSVLMVYTDDVELSYPNSHDIDCFKCLADSIRLTSKIVDTPCADMTTDDFLNEIKLVAKELGLHPTVVEGEELNKRGFGGIYNVGKAAVVPPKLVVLSHLTSKARRTIAWVGKGIVYDTGGLCIKSRPNMCGMKKDCGGAAAVLGAFYAAVKMGFEDNLHAVFCLAENAVGPNALRPDDIIKLYSGKTVEITNTDAEGRLVLGDGVCYASKDLKADIIVDIATLTGAQGAATGRYHGAVLTNNEKWESASVEIGKACGDLCFPLVFAPEFHFSEYNTDFADMRNSVIKPDNAASACAGLFIHSHLDSKFDGIWIHFDIASPVSESHDRATGFGVALLNSLFADSFTNATIKLFEHNVKHLPTKNANADSETESEE